MSSTRLWGIPCDWCDLITKNKQGFWKMVYLERAHMYDNRNHSYKCGQAGKLFQSSFQSKKDRHFSGLLTTVLFWIAGNSLSLCRGFWEWERILTPYKTPPWLAPVWQSSDHSFQHLGAYEKLMTWNALCSFTGCKSWPESDPRAQPLRQLFVPSMNCRHHRNRQGHLRQTLRIPPSLHPGTEMNEHEWAPPFYVQDALKYVQIGHKCGARACVTPSLNLILQSPHSAIIFTVRGLSQACGQRLEVRQQFWKTPRKKTNQ